MKSELILGKEKREMNIIDEVNGIETITSSVIIEPNKIILQTNNNDKPILKEEITND